MSKYALQWSATARVEVRHAVQHYLRQNPQAGARLHEEVQGILASLREAPRQWAVWRPPDIRRRLLVQFPYALVYTVPDAKRVVLLALLHQHQDSSERFPP